jgi:hypothetical protein
MLNEEKQAILEVAVMAIVTQGGPSSVMDHDRSTCAYRRTDGRKCAIGHLITDEHYDPLMEGVGVSDSRVYLAVERSLGIELDMDDIEFLHQLQLGHDKSAADELRDEYWSLLSGDLMYLCNVFGLRFPEELI